MARLLSAIFRGGRGRPVTVASSSASRAVFDSIMFTPGATATVYLGPSAWSTRYLGVRADSAMYLGSGTLHL